MRVYLYGARPPVENAEEIYRQIRLANTYQRVLILIERKRREVVDLLYRRACPIEHAEYDAAAAAVSTAIDAVRRCRTRPGDMLEPDQDMKAEEREIFDEAKTALLAAREREGVARQVKKDARKRATPKLRPRLRMCDAGAQVRAKLVYNRAGDVGLAWGTRLKIGESVERAAKTAAKIGAMPHLPKFDGSGMISVQLQGDSSIPGASDMKGISPEDAMSGTDTRLRLQVVDEATWQAAQGTSNLMGNGGALVKNGPRAGQPRQPLPQPVAGSKRSLKRARVSELGACAIVKLRIGSDARAPVWGAWPVSLLRRPLPMNAPIKWAQILVRRVGPSLTWWLLLTVQDELPSIKTGNSTLAVNLGWRNLLDGGLRVAYAIGSDGHEEEVRVPPEYVTGIAKVDSLRSIRDRLHEDAKEALVAWLGEAERSSWLIEATRYVDRWKSQKHLVWLLRDWKEQRFDGDVEMFELLAAWRKKDRHLWLWESHHRDALLERRRHFYRCVAVKWAKAYDHVIITDMDLRDFAELPEPEDAADTEGRVQRRSRMLAAPSELRGAIENATGKEGTCCPRRVQRDRAWVIEGACAAHADVAERLGPWKTQTCNACGIVFAFAAKEDLARTCECGARWDQDANHCRNLLASASVVRGTGGLLTPPVTGSAAAGSRVRESRWKKKRSKSSPQVIKKIKR